MSSTPLVPATYPQLRDAVIAVVVKGRRAIDLAWVDTYHETGRLINVHVLLFRNRANYGAKVYEKLAADTAISRRTLRECAQFYRYFPIVRHVAQLGWNRCRLLCQVEDEPQRAALTAQAVKHDLSSGKIVERVRQINALAPESGLSATTAQPLEPVELLKPRCGTPGLHLVVERPGGLGIDLGFKTYADLPDPDSTAGRASRRWTKGDIVRLDEAGARKIDDATKADLFTYRATIRKVIDGDTLDIAILLAPGITRDLKLRLRGLDCPEIATAAGRAAKAFVDALLRPGDEIILSTTKPDKYDRYLADVFVTGTTSRDARSDADAAPLFLNNALLSAGHAVRYDGGAKEE